MFRESSVMLSSQETFPNAKRGSSQVEVMKPSRRNVLAFSLTLSRDRRARLTSMVVWPSLAQLPVRMGSLGRVLGSYPTSTCSMMARLLVATP